MQGAGWGCPLFLSGGVRSWASCGRLCFCAAAIAQEHITPLQASAPLAGGKRFTSCICLLLARFPRGVSAQRGDVIGGTNSSCAGVAAPVASGQLAARQAPGHLMQQPGWWLQGWPRLGCGRCPPGKQPASPWWRWRCLGLFVAGAQASEFQHFCWKWCACKFRCQRETRVSVSTRDGVLSSSLGHLSHVFCEQKSPKSYR